MQNRFTDLMVITVVVLALLLVGSVHANVKGTINAESGWYPAGTNLTVTAEPVDEYRYVEWRGDTNDAQITATQLSFTVSGARQVDVVFKDHITENLNVPWWWLAQFFQDLTTSADFEAAADGTHNGSSLTAGQAYWSGTDPMGETARFEILKAEMAGGHLQLSWAHTNVAANLPPILIEGRISMTTDDWVYVDEYVPVDGTVNWQVPENSDHRFFRLRVDTP